MCVCVLCACVCVSLWVIKKAREYIISHFHTRRSLVIVSFPTVTMDLIVLTAKFSPACTTRHIFTLSILVLFKCHFLLFQMNMHKVTATFHRAKLVDTSFIEKT